MVIKVSLDFEKVQAYILNILATLIIHVLLSNS